MSELIKINGLSKFFGSQSEIKAVDDINLTINTGSFTVILGRSGSGKSTLLNIFAGLDTPSKGELKILGNDMSKYSQTELSNYRGEIGIIFQSYNLLGDLTVLENVLMGGWAAGNNNINEYSATKILKKIGLDHRTHSNIKTLSGGEKQRVAIARALVNEPKVLFCDEPTGALDSKNEKEIMEMLKELNNKGITIIMVTHNSEFQKLASQVITMKDGKIIENKIK